MVTAIIINNIRLLVSALLGVSGLGCGVKRLGFGGFGV